MVAMMKPRIAMLDTRKVKTLAPDPIATPRMRGRAWMNKRARWLSDHPLCVMCEQRGRVTAAQHVDHVIELQDGGKDDESNYQSLCVACHQIKTTDEARIRARG